MPRGANLSVGLGDLTVEVPTAPGTVILGVSRRKFLKSLAAGATLGCACRPLIAQAVTKPSSRFDNFDVYAQRAMRRWNVPGLAVAIVRDGKPVHLQGYGVRRLDDPGLVDEKTLFPIASATKSFTATAIAKLVDQGKLDWGDSALDYLPTLGIDRRITIRHLLCHRSGLPSADLLWSGGALDSDAILAKLKLLRPIAKPGQRFLYNNLMYLVAGRIVEAVAAQPWSEFVHDELFAPLEMQKTVANSSGIQSVDNVATPHARLSGKTQAVERYCPDVIAPSGTIHSNVSDMARWLLFHLEPRGRSVTPILSQARLAEMHSAPPELPDESQPRSSTTPHAPISNYGLGWFFNDHKGATVVEHSGTQNGFVAWVALVPSEHFGFVLLANDHRTGLNYALRSWLLDACCVLPERDWSEIVWRDYSHGYQRLIFEAKVNFEAERATDTTPSHPISAYAGTYVSPLYGPLGISGSVDSLALEFGSRFRGRLVHWSEESFRVLFDNPLQEDWLLNFKLAEGTIKAVDVTVAPWAPDWFEDGQALGEFERT
jgi:CubicO group peptidase (beta-lactamase class C family)